jgi:hypothetical protein
VSSVVESKVELKQRTTESGQAHGARIFSNRRNLDIVYPLNYINTAWVLSAFSSAEFIPLEFLFLNTFLFINVPNINLRFGELLFTCSFLNKTLLVFVSTVEF